MMQRAFVLASLGVATVAIDQAYVDELNSRPGMLWKAALSSRFHNNPGSFKRQLGAKPIDAELLASIARYNSSAYNVELPSAFDSEANWPHCAKTIGDIRDQSNCGCCWAFGAASAASDRLCIATNAKHVTALSTNAVCFCASGGGCGGGDIVSPWVYIAEGAVTGGQQKFNTSLHGPNPDPFANAGLCSRFPLPHCHHHGPVRNDPFPSEDSKGCPSEDSRRCPTKCDSGSKGSFDTDKFGFDKSDLQTASGEHAIMNAIHEGGPVETAFDVYKDFEAYAGGIYKQTSQDQLGGHAVRIVGWGEEQGTKYWKVANSWNPYWGEKGYFRIVKGVDECGIESTVSFSSAQANWKKH